MLKLGEGERLHEENKTLEAQNCQLLTTSLSSIASEGSELGLSEVGEINNLVNNHLSSAQHMKEDRSSDCIYTESAQKIPKSLAKTPKQRKPGRRGRVKNFLINYSDKKRDLKSDKKDSESGK